MLLAFSLATQALLASSPLTQVTDFGDNPGNLAMYEHIPSTSGPLPLVLALHGCGQTHQYAIDSGLVDASDKDGFALVVAEQSTSNNIQACFNWFQQGDIERDQGEAKSLASMVAKVKQTSSIDASKVFVTGVSAGAAMAVVMLADYPDVFAAGSVFAGIPFGCATNLNDAFTCMQSSKQLSQSDWTALVPSSTTHPHIQIWQGTSDHTVNPANADALALQWTGVNAISSQPASTTTDGPATKSVFGAGEVELIKIANMDHGIPLDPQHNCGTAQPFLLDVGVCSTSSMTAFFGLTASEGEGSAGEGEGEGEGEGATKPSKPAGCASTTTEPPALFAALGLGLAALGRRWRRSDR